MSLPSANLRKKTTFQKRRKSTQPHLKCLRVLRWLMLSNWRPIELLLTIEMLPTFEMSTNHLLLRITFKFIVGVLPMQSVTHFVRGHHFVRWIKMVNAV